MGVAAAGMVALLPGACGFQQEPLKLPISNWPGYEYFYLASKLGLDRRQGLEINPVQYPDPQSIVHAYLRGELPIAPLTTVEAVDLCARIPRRCPVVVLVLDESAGGDQVAVRNDVPSIAALRGKTVAVTFSTLGPYVLSRALQRHGLSFNDVTVRNIPLAQMPAALAKGEVQAAAFFPPFSEYAARKGQSRVLFDSSQIPGEIFDVLVVDPTYLRQHQDQIVALVRTSVNQVANTSSMQVYEANQDVTTSYRYVATLDARTSSICRALDGREFPYGQGPQPPQHFNCRSTAVPVIRADILPPSTTATRASAGGQVPINMSYGEWLSKQPRSVQEDVLGKSKVGYFQLLSEKHGPGDAMAKLVRDDGSELTLEQLRRRYGTP